MNTSTQRRRHHCRNKINNRTPRAVVGIAMMLHARASSLRILTPCFKDAPGNNWRRREPLRTARHLPLWGSGSLHEATRTDEFSSAAEQQKLWEARAGRAAPHAHSVAGIYASDGRRMRLRQDVRNHGLRLMRIPSLAYMPATEGA